MSQEDKAHLEGSGAIAQDDSIAAGERGVAVGGDVRQSPIVTGDHNVVTVVYQGVELTIPSPPAIERHRAALRERLELDARTRWGGMSVYIQEEGATLPIQASPYQTGRLGPRENLLGLLHAANRLLVLGEPGSGKTVALERLAWEVCGGKEPAVPVLMRLFHYAGIWGSKPWRYISWLHWPCSFSVYGCVTKYPGRSECMIIPASFLMKSWVT